MLVNRKVAAATALTVSIAGVILVASSWNTAGGQAGGALSSEREVQAAPAQPAVPSRTVGFLEGIEQGWISAGFRGDGMDLLFSRVQNQLDESIRVVLPAGLVLETDPGEPAQNQIILVRSAVLDLAPHGLADERLYSAATNSGNKPGDYPFLATATQLPLVMPLLNHLAENPAVSAPAVQTAVLAVTENLPLGAFAKFSLINETPLPVDTTVFRVNVRDIVSALQLLEAAGYDPERIALTVDPQLKIEAMCDRLSHAAAMKYYQIQPEQEWQYWYDELLKGDPSTRHYALYGIARYFPEVAMEMMPTWARSEKLNAVFRISSVIALAETRRPEAISVLAQLNYELADTEDLRRATEEASRYLENYVNPPDRRPADIEWRLTQTMKLLTGAN